MMEIGLDMYQSAAIGAVALAFGTVLISRSDLLKRFCIPAAVIGGLCVSMVTLVLYTTDVAEVTFDGTLQNIFMMGFFSSIGFLASFRQLRKGGRLVVVLLALTSMLIILQDTLGPMLCELMGMDPRMGLALGSISLIGGHGTAASYAPQLIEMGVEHADVVAMAAATFGLAVSSFIGGPLEGDASLGTR